MTRPTADLGEDGELERHARKMRQDLCDELPNGVGNTIDALLDRLILYREALAFYADPENYHAISFLADPPCGSFADDFSDDHGHEDYDRAMPGKRARDVLSRSA